VNVRQGSDVKYADDIATVASLFCCVVTVAAVATTTSAAVVVDGGGVQHKQKVPMAQSLQSLELF